MIQKIEERKIKSIINDNLLFTPQHSTTVRKQADINIINKERATLDIRVTNQIQLDLC